MNHSLRISQLAFCQSSFLCLPVCCDRSIFIRNPLINTVNAPISDMSFGYAQVSKLGSNPNSFRLERFVNVNLTPAHYRVVNNDHQISPSTQVILGLRLYLY
ncbi:hypothetical protein CPB83DRAFT_860953 [Crepidotus variabilis]|uniref:Uncharacterized protein n=1 Tax=Crepidotus variabilis TaxID=179855 RepID=A0A9P6E903_9AGAR|nr:hypothetical protein CPB83DRAFT_860953 [Crepidotus variabilis]